MALRFRLRGLAETLIEEVSCPCCGSVGEDDGTFSATNTKVTLQGIIAVLQCKSCDEIFVPENQKLDIADTGLLEEAVKEDHQRTGEPLLHGFSSVLHQAEMLNATRKGQIH